MLGTKICNAYIEMLGCGLIGTVNIFRPKDIVPMPFGWRRIATKEEQTLLEPFSVY
ncbi:MAG: hypothetical protein ACLTE2_10115 [Eubacteriales bacterium]